MKKSELIAGLLFFAVFSIGCASHQPRQAILLIGDGMGPTQIASAREILSKSVPGYRDAFSRFEVHGKQRTRSASHAVTDSAASATAMATGTRTINQHLGVDTKDKPLVSIARMEKGNGGKVAILSSQPIDHATPGAFYGNSKVRTDYGLIASQLPGTKFDFVGGGAIRGRVGPGKVDTEKKMVEAGYVVVTNRAGLAAIADGSLVYVHGKTDAQGEMAPYVDYLRRSDGNKDGSYLRLPELTSAALGHIGDSGFFMMVEGGQIDTACHANDFGTFLREYQEFNDVVNLCLDYAEKHCNVLVVATADHETGGLRAKGAARLAPEAALRKVRSQPSIQNKLRSMSKTANGAAVVAALDEYYGGGIFTADEKAQLAKRWEEKRDPVDLSKMADKFFAASFGYEFTTGGHSAADVDVFAKGPGAAAFNGTNDNTNIFFGLKQYLE